MGYNIPTKLWITPKVKIKESYIQGRGLFAIKPIKQGEKVIIWGGDNYVDYEGMLEAKKQGKLIMRWDDNLYSYEDRGDDDTYFLNHSCDPNLWMGDTFTLTAKRDIQKGEEILVDYAMFEGDEYYISKWECKCKSINCRKKISGKDWQIPRLQKEYAGHFVPYINRKIFLSASQN